MRKLIATLVGLAFIAAVVATSVAGSTAEAAEKVIRIGAPLPLTGGLATEGLKQQRGYDLWAEVVNKAGGIKVGSDRYKVELVYNDYQSTTPRAVQLAEKLITDDKVNFLFAPFGSGATKAVSSVSEKYGIPMIAATASSDEVYNQGYRYLFGVLYPNRALTESVAEVLRKKLPDAKKIAILARNDLFPLAMAQEAEKSAKKRGFDVVFFEKYAIGTLDHASALTQIRATQPHWIFATGYTNDLILIRKQMRDLGVSAPVVTMITMYVHEFIAATGPLAETLTSAVWWHPAVRYKGPDVFGSTENYNKLFEAKYKMSPDAVGGEAGSSAAGVVLQFAIERAGTLDPKKVRDALAATDITTFYGPVKFGPTGMAVSLEAPVIQVQNAEAVVIAPDAIKQGELRIGVK